MPAKLRLGRRSSGLPPHSAFQFFQTRFARLFRFLAVGIPAFLIAIPLNWFLVDQLLWPKPAAYALVLVVQVTINFFACILFVFKRDASKSLWSQFLLFMSGILLARVLDWALYSLLVRITPIHYLVLQFANVVLFSVAKFLFARRALEGKANIGSQTPEAAKDSVPPP